MTAVFLLVSLACYIALTCATLPRRDAVEGPFQHFKTEPDFKVFVINTTYITPNRSRLADGYRFIAPYRFNPSKAWRPQMFDQDGNLIWYFPPSPREVEDNQIPRCQSITVCDYLGSKGSHLCWAQSDGQNRIFDNTYREIEEPYRALGSMPSPDAHEFRMMPGGKSFLRIVLPRRTADLRYTGAQKNGIVIDACFQEIKVKTRRVMFHWCFLDHYKPNDSGYLIKDGKHAKGAGTGLIPWDFAHINSVDKNEEGDYLVSIRHMDNIMKIAGKNNNKRLKPGTTIWRAGGRKSDFKMLPGSEMSVQHMARFVSTGSSESVVSIFNNDFRRVNTVTKGSQVLLIRLNNETMEASLEKMYPHPRKLRSPAQGGYNWLPNGNLAVGWGGRSHFSEFSADGELLHHAQFSNSNNLSSYRSHKFQWEGNPRQKPKVLAYCKRCVMTAAGGSAPLVVYASYNGATKLASWRFSVSFTSARGPWLVVDTFAKAGFETMAKLSTRKVIDKGQIARWVRAEALDANGLLLNREIAETFVPKPPYVDSNRCRTLSCDRSFRYTPSSNYVRSCEVGVVGGTQNAVNTVNTADVGTTGSAAAAVGALEAVKMLPSKINHAWGSLVLVVTAIELASFALNFFWDSTTTAF